MWGGRERAVSALEPVDAGSGAPLFYRPVFCVWQGAGDDKLPAGRVVSRGGRVYVKSRQKKGVRAAYQNLFSNLLYALVYFHNLLI